jgi:hypothetical protein
MSALFLVFFDASLENYSMKCLGADTTLGALFIAFLILVSAGPVRGQEDPQPGREPAFFGAQLLQFTQLSRRTLREIQALPVDDSVPVDSQVHRKVRQAYVLIRAARWG